MLGHVGAFSLTERSGRTVTDRDLEGRVWVVDFFFTTCTGPCPVMAPNMRRLQDELEGTPVRLVSISVDPQIDTPEVLRTYANAYTADPERWWFLTGDAEATYRLIRESFLLAVERASPDQEVLGMQMSHSTRFVVVDQRGDVRGYYDGTTDEGRKAAGARARWLALPPGAKSRLPLLNATLNGVCALLLALGLAAIHRQRRELHGWLMRSAFIVSSLFLASYLYYHFAVARGQPTQFNREGAAKMAYLALLLSHTALAVVNLPMVLRTLWLAHKERWDDHRRWARRTFPIWMYVSVTGVAVYVVLYHLNPPAG